MAVGSCSKKMNPKPSWKPGQSPLPRREAGGPILARNGRPAIGTNATLEHWSILTRLTAEEWRKIVGALPGRIGARARKSIDTRRFVEAVLWVAQTNAFWSDLPREYGPWHSIYVRFIRWSQDGIWDEVLASLEDGDSRRNDLRILGQRYLAKTRAKAVHKTSRQAKPGPGGAEATAEPAA